MRASKARNTPVTGSLSRTRLWVGRLGLLVAAPALVLCGAELGLRAVGYGYDPHFLVRDEEDREKLRDNDRFAWRFFPPALARAPQPLRVDRHRPPELKRVVVFGGSAAMGDPEPAFGLPRVLQCLLERRHPRERFEIINAAVTAINSHVVLPIARDCRILDADAWVVYMGNNEVNGPYGSGSVFGGQRPPLGLIRASLAYRKMRLGQWMAAMIGPGDDGVPGHWGGMEMFLGQQVPASDPDLERVRENFAANLSDLLELARAGEVPVVLSTVAVNLEDSPPFFSERLPENADAIQALLEERRWHEAEASCRESLARGEVGTSAESHFYLGTALAGQGKDEEARTSFQRACDLDTLRFRADSAINQIIREVGGVHLGNARLVDGERVLSEADPNGIPGKAFFHEHVHLTFSGNHRLGVALAEACEDVLGLSGGAPWPDEETCAEALGLTAYHRREILREMRTRLKTAPFRGQFGHEKRDAELGAAIGLLGAELTPAAAREAARKYTQRIASDPGDWILRQQFAALLNSVNQLEEATVQWEAVVEAIPHDPASWFQLGAVRNRLRRWSDAESALRKAISLRERHPRAWNSLGICLSQQGRFEEAYASFAMSGTHGPDFAEAFMNWGMVLENRGDRDEARVRFEQALQADPEHAPSHVELAQLLVKLGDFERAAEIYERIVMLLPEDPGARINLALVYLKLGRREEGIKALEAALERDPGNRLALEYLGKLRGAP